MTTHVVKASVNGFLTYEMIFRRIIFFSFVFADSGLFAAAHSCISSATFACILKAAGN